LDREGINKSMNNSAQLTSAIDQFFFRELGEFIYF